MTLWRRFQRTDLSIRLAVFSAGLAALVIVATFAALNVQVRRSTHDLFSSELARNGRTLVALQRETRRHLVLTATLLAESPTLESAMSTYRLEMQSGSAPRADLNATVQRVINRLGQDVPGDALLVTDANGVVFAGYARGAPDSLIGADLSALPAMHNALDPTLVTQAEEPYLAGLEAGKAFYGVGVAPLIVDGFTVGTIVFGQRVDSSTMAILPRDFGGEIVVTAGNNVISTTLSPAEARQFMANRSSGASAIYLEGNEYLLARIGLGKTQRGTPLGVTLLQPLTPVVQSLTWALGREFLIYGLLAIVLAAIGAMFLSRSLMQPLMGFIRFMRRGADRECVDEVFNTEGASQEIRVLNESFTQLMASLTTHREELERFGSDLLATNAVLTDEIREREKVEQALRNSEAQLRQSQKLEAIGTLAGGIAHDFNNMLTVISGFTQMAVRSLGKDHPVSSDLKQVSDAADSAAGLTHQLLAFSRKQVLQSRVLDLNLVVTGMEQMLRRLIGARIELAIVAEDDQARIRADPGQIEQVVLNLVVNARDAMPDGGVLSISVVREARDSGSDQVVLRVEDSGIGMRPDVRDRIFEPFYTTKDVGKGTGLGLSTVYGIVTQSGGAISVDSTYGKGTMFTVRLPAIGEAATPVDGGDQIAPLARAGEVVVVVDDQEAVLELARRSLEDCGYEVLVARSGVEALTMFSTTQTVDVLVTDVVMSQLSGPQLAGRFAIKYPGTAVIYMTGYVDDETLRLEMNGDVPLLRKPFTPAELARAVRSVLDERSKAGATA